MRDFRMSIFFLNDYSYISWNFALNELLCDSRMSETDCQKETEEKGQVATNDDEDDDDHVVSREMCMRVDRNVHVIFFFATIS